MKISILFILFSFFVIGLSYDGPKKFRFEKKENPNGTKKVKINGKIVTEKCVRYTHHLYADGFKFRKKRNDKNPKKTLQRAQFVCMGCEREDECVSVMVQMFIDPEGEGNHEFIIDESTYPPPGAHHCMPDGTEDMVCEFYNTIEKRIIENPAQVIVLNVKVKKNQTIMYF